MSTSGWLATWLDWEMIELGHGIPIQPPMVPVDDLPEKHGRDVFEELGGRFLLRYVPEHQLGLFGQGSGGRHYTTPTPYASEETVS